MKFKTFFSSVFIFIGIASIAQNNSSLTIRFSEPGEYEVIINQKRFKTSDVFKINEISSGLYNIQIIKVDFSPYLDKGLKNTIYTGNIYIEEGISLTYKLQRNAYLKLQEKHLELDNSSKHHEPNTPFISYTRPKKCYLLT